MSKVGSTSPLSTRVSSGRTYWVRNGIAMPAGDDQPTPTPPKPPGGKRFVEPYRLTDEQRATLIAPLADMGIGDAESRGLFAAAMEYDLAGCRALTEPAPDPVPRPAPTGTEGALAELAQAAQSLAELIERMDDSTATRLQQCLADTDRFKRRYDQDYLKSLRCELLRVAGAGRLAERPAAPSPSPLSEEARRFVLRAADAFGDCFELTASAGPGTPFAAAIAAIVAATGVQIPTDLQALSQILAQG